MEFKFFRDIDTKEILGSISLPVNTPQITWDFVLAGYENVEWV